MIKLIYLRSHNQDFQIQFLLHSQPGNYTEYHMQCPTAFCLTHFHLELLLFFNNINLNYSPYKKQKTSPERVIIILFIYVIK